MSGERPHLFVGVPSRSGRISEPLHRYLASMEALALAGQFPMTVSVAIVTGLTPVQFARNVLCRLALAEPARTDDDRVLMIDDDMRPDASCTRTIFSDADICVPRMFRFRHHGPDALDDDPSRPPEIASCATLVRGDDPDDRVDVFPLRDDCGTYRVDAAGTGFIVIRRRVLADERMLCGDPDPDGTPALFRLVQSATGRISDWEDVDFTLRASRLGYLVAADFGAHCGHSKEINLDAVAELVYRGNVQRSERFADIKTAAAAAAEEWR